MKQKGRDAIGSLKYRLETFYFSFIKPVLGHGHILYAGTSKKNFNRIDNTELEAMGLVTGVIPRSCIALLKLEANWEVISVQGKNYFLVKN